MDDGVVSGRDGSADRTVERVKSERTGDREKIGDGRREADKATSPVGSWGGQMPPPSSPLAATRKVGAAGKVGLSGLSRGVAGALSAKAKLESFLVGKSADGAASVRMTLSLGEKGNLAVTVQEGLKGEGVRILLNAPNMADAETAALASDLLKNLHSQGVQVETVESLDGRELASDGGQGQGARRDGSHDGSELAGQSQVERNDPDSEAVSPVGRPINPWLRGLHPAGSSGFFG